MVPAMIEISFMIDFANKTVIKTRDNELTKIRQRWRSSLRFQFCFKSFSDENFFKSQEDSACDVPSRKKTFPALPINVGSLKVVESNGSD